MAFLIWLLDHWMPIVIVILVLGTILDCIVYWRKPFFYEPIKGLILRIRHGKPDQPPAPEAAEGAEAFAQSADAQQIAQSMRQENTYVDLNGPEGAVMVPEWEIAGQPGEEPAPAADGPIAELPAQGAEGLIAQPPAQGAEPPADFSPPSEDVWAAGARPARQPADQAEQLTLLPGMAPAPVARHGRYRLRIIPYDPSVHLRLRVRPRASVGQQLTLPLMEQEGEARDES